MRIFVLLLNYAQFNNEQPNGGKPLLLRPGGKLTFIGQYYNTFRVDVTNP